MLLPWHGGKLEQITQDEGWERQDGPPTKPPWSVSPASTQKPRPPNPGASSLATKTAMGLVRKVPEADIGEPGQALARHALALRKDRPELASRSQLLP